MTGALFFVSGLSSLIYQVAWQRVLTQEIGVDSLSIAFIVTIFMMGLGLGSLAGGWISFRFGRSLPYLYAGIELLIGLLGACSIPAVRHVNRAAAGSESVLWDFAVNCPVLVLPTFLMGLTTPIIVEFLKGTLDNLGSVIGLFYGLNVLGAALGSILTLFLIELLGLQGSVNVAAGINLVIAVAFFTAASRLPEFSPKAVPAGEAPAERPSASGLDCRILLASLLFGFANLSIEMVLFRFLFFYFSPASFVFPMILSAYLALMALGQFLGGRWIDRRPPEARPALLALLLVGAAVSLLVLCLTPLSALDLIRPRSPKHNISILPYGFVISFFFNVPVIFFSAYLPAVAKMATRDIRTAGRTFGSILFCSTLGNIFGGFITAIFLFESIGSIRTLVLVCWATLAGVGLMFWQSGGEGRGRGRAFSAAVASVILATILVPRDYYFSPLSDKRPAVKMIGADKPVAVLEGHTTVTPIFLNGHTKQRYEVRPFNAGAAAALIDEKSVYYQYYSLVVPQMADPEFRPKRILLIGLGSGEFPFVMKELDFVQEFVIVELAPEVLEAYEKYSDSRIAETLHHPKVKVHATDGRRYVQKALARGEQFDLVQIGILGLTRSGASNIYSLDFMRKVRQIVRPGGYLALEPYIGIARLGFEFFQQGYVLPGSSWVFMHDHPLGLQDGQSILVSEYTMRQYLSKRFSDLKTPLQPPYPTARVTIIEYDRAEVLERYRNMVGTDDRLIFEYFYLSELRPDFAWPVLMIQDMDNLTPKRVELEVSVRESTE